MNWLCVFKMFLYFFKHITYKSRKENFISRLGSNLIISTAQTSVDIGIHRHHISPEILESDYPLTHTDIKVSITHLKSCNLDTIPFRYKSFAIQRNAHKGTPLPPQVFPVQYSLQQCRQEMLSRKNKASQPVRSGQTPQQTMNLITVLTRFI